MRGMFILLPISNNVLNEFFSLFCKIENNFNYTGIPVIIIA